MAYTTKELILATKGKISEIEGKLRTLAELTKGDKNVESVIYDIRTSNNEKPELSFRVNMNRKRVKGFLDQMLSSSGIYSFNGSYGKVLTDNNGRSYLKIDGFDLYVKDCNQEMFGRVSSEILGDEFVPQFFTCMPPFYAIGRDEAKVQSIYLSPKNITITNTLNGDYTFRLQYSPLDRTMSVQPYDGQRISSEMLQDAFSRPLDPAFPFSYQQREFMDAHYVIGGEILISDFSDCKGTANFYVGDTEKGLYLTKKD